MQTEAGPTDVKSRKKSPRDTAKFWQKELEQSEKFLKKFHTKGTKVVQRFLDDRGEAGGLSAKQFRLNLFNSNIRTLQDMLYSQLPKVTADRSHYDANDDQARVAANMIERLINTDISDNPKDYDSVLRSCLQDRLLPGLGVARVRFEFKKEPVNVPAQFDPTGQVMISPPIQTVRITDEAAPIDYYHWQDVLWGWARCYSEVPWIAYRSYMGKDKVEARFGAEAAKGLSYKKRKAADADDAESRPEDDAPWMQAEIWEIWDKSERTVFWYSPGYERMLDKKPDPLKLNNFFPSPEFMIANATTTLYRPVSDYYICQDLYNEVDDLQTRISMLTTAVKAVGVYSSEDDGIKRMLKEGCENELIPVDDWAMFAEKGGIRGVVDWMPITDIVNALDKLRDLRDDTIGLLQRISGMADVMQGGLQNQYEGVGQTQIKAQFGSVRVQALQDSFAGFAADLLQLKAEVICKHFQPQTIVQMSNMERTFDADQIQSAIQLIKDPKMAHIRITVKPEQVAMVDFARLKVERTEFLNAMATFMQSAGPLLQAEPDSMPTLLKMLQWTMAGFKGSSEIEGVLDDAVEAAEKKQQDAIDNPEPDPEQVKAEMAQKAAQEKLQGELQKIQAKGQADMQLRQADLQADIQTTEAQTTAKIREIIAAHQANMAETQAKLKADVLTAQVEGQVNIQQTEADAGAEIAKDENQSRLNIEEELLKTELAIDQDSAQLETELLKDAVSTGNELTKMREQAYLTPEKEESDGE